MSDPTTPDREPGPLSLLARLFLTQLLAVIAIAAVLTVVVSALGGGLDDDVTAGTRPADRSGTPTATGPTSTPSQTPPASPSSSPPATTSAPATTSSAPVEDDRPRVDVLNQSAPGGSAGAVADGLRQRDWRIGRVDDFTGNVAADTVYFPPGLRRDARALAKDLPGSPRLMPAFSTISGSRLTVILVD